MKLKTFLILLVCVALLGAVAFFTLRSGNGGSRARSLGQPVLADLPFDQVEKIRIVSGQAAIGLERSPQGWGIEQRQGYPADFAKISDLVEKLRKMKIGKQFSVTDEIRGRLALYPPGDAKTPKGSSAVRVTLLDKENRPLTDLLIGNARDSETGYGGQYLMRVGQDTVFLVDQSFKFLETAPGEWIHRQVVDLDTDTIRSVAVYRGGAAEPRYRLERESKDAPFTLAAGAVQGPLKKDKVNRVVRALSPLRAEDVLPAGKAGGEISFDRADRFEYRTEDGRSYRVELGSSFSRQDETYTYLRMEKYTASPEAPDAAPSAPDKEEDKIENPGGETGKWIYVISKWKNEDFIRNPEQLVEAADKGAGAKKS